MPESLSSHEVALRLLTTRSVGITRELNDRHLGAHDYLGGTRNSDYFGGEVPTGAKRGSFLPKRGQDCLRPGIEVWSRPIQVRGLQILTRESLKTRNAKTVERAIHVTRTPTCNAYVKEDPEGTVTA